MNNLDQIKSLLTDVIKLSDGKIVININFFNSSDTQSEPIKENRLPISDKPEEWISVPRASQLYNLSEAFFYLLTKNHPKLRTFNKDGQILFNRNLLEDYLKSHPEHYEASKNRIRTESTGVLLQKAIELLKKDKRELYPERGIARSLRSQYYTYREMSEKLGCSYNTFNTKLKTLLTESLKQDTEYQAWIKSKGEEKKTYDELIEKAIEILDREGRAFKSYSGRNCNSDEYMGAKELADRLEISYGEFNAKIKPALQGEIIERRTSEVEQKIEDWKCAHISVRKE